MRFRLHFSQTLAATYGSYYDPTKRAGMHTLAENFDITGLFEAPLREFRANWRSDDYSGSPSEQSRQATDQMKRDLTAYLRLRVPSGDHYTLVDPVGDASVFYRILLDQEGNVIGHVTILWVYFDGQPIVIQEEADGHFDFGIIATLLLATEKAP